jgi:lipopolysaccharide transport system permease protein
MPSRHVAGVNGHRQPTIILPAGGDQGLGLRELWDYRSVAGVLTRRNLMVRYRQTVVGVGWVLIQPLALMLVLSIFFSLLDRFGQPGVPFPVFYLCALWMWTPLVKVVNEGALSIIANMQLVTRVYVPRALIPFSVAAATLVDLFFGFLIFQVILLVFGFVATEFIVLLPVLMLVGYLTVLGFSYFLAALNTRYRDVQLALPFLIQLWFFMSPVIYPAEWIPEAYQPWFYLNPMALVITGSRWMFAGMAPPPDYAWILGLVVSLLSLVGGYLYFRRTEPTFADEL